MTNRTLDFVMTYGWAILVVLVAIGALAYFGVLDPTKHTKYNPDIHVCEEWKCDDFDEITGHCYIYSDIECEEHRLKTICELNPTDSENCTCDEYTNSSLYCKFDYQTCNVRIQTKDYTKWTTKEKIKASIPIIGETPKEFIGNCEMNQDVENGSVQITDEFIDKYCEIKQTCIKAHEKNECEKEQQNK